MSSQVLHEDHQLLLALALAMVCRPRASLQELAKAAGVSKATLYRFSPTREQLYERLVEHALRVLDDSIQEADLHRMPLREALQRLTSNALEHRELLVFLMHHRNKSAASQQFQATWDKELDTFFLRGQREGWLRVDIPAPALTEIYVATLTGLIDAEQRGRVARVGLAVLIETAFISGTLAQ